MKVKVLKGALIIAIEKRMEVHKAKLAEHEAALAPYDDSWKQWKIACRTILRRRLPKVLPSLDPYVTHAGDVAFSLKGDGFPAPPTIQAGELRRRIDEVKSNMARLASYKNLVAASAEESLTIDTINDYALGECF